jgi:hypothetical protein
MSGSSSSSAEPDFDPACVGCHGSDLAAKVAILQHLCAYCTTQQPPELVAYTQNAIAYRSRQDDQSYRYDQVRGGTCAARACKRAGPFPPSTPQVVLSAARAARIPLGDTECMLGEQ